MGQETVKEPTGHLLIKQYSRGRVLRRGAGGDKWPKSGRKRRSKDQIPVGLHFDFCRGEKTENSTTRSN